MVSQRLHDCEGELTTNYHIIERCSVCASRNIQATERLHSDRRYISVTHRISWPFYDLGCVLLRTILRLIYRHSTGHRAAQERLRDNIRS